MQTFILTLLALALQGQENPNIRFRGHLDHSRIRFEKERKGHVAFMGGSITEMDGYRPRVMEILKKRFPKTAFRFTDAGISSTCSTTGAFRLEEDVLSKGPVDLLFVEFAVNDDQDAGHSREACIRGMEGIVRHLRRHNPRADIVITYFVNPGMLKTLQAGKIPLTIESHEKVAVHYGVSSIHLAREVARSISAGTMTWKQYGGTHPSRTGNRIAAGLIEMLLNTAWKRPASAKAHPTPDAIDPLNYERGRFLDPAKAELGKGWTLAVPDWTQIPGKMRDRFRNVPILDGNLARVSRNLKVTFEGRAIGVYILSGPDTGEAAFRIDKQEPKRVRLDHRFGKNLHYPRTVMFATDLPPGKHTLELNVAGSPFTEGYAIRIMKFVVN